MEILKLILEVAVLALLFVLLRKSLIVFFPALAAKSSAKSAKAQPIRSMIFLFNGAMASLVFFWLFYGVIYLIHSLGSAESVLVISRGSLVVPSLIFGFYTSTHLTEYLYREFFIQERIAVQRIEAASRQSMTYQRLFSALTLIPGILLLAFQFNVYIKTDGEHIYKRELGGSEQVFSLADVKKVNTLSSEEVEIYLNDGQVISTGGYSGNINYFLDNIAP